MRFDGKALAQGSGEHDGQEALRAERTDVAIHFCEQGIQQESPADLASVIATCGYDEVVQQGIWLAGTSTGYICG